ncbi:MAG: glycosyltransferase family 9 protein [Pseudoflavonifractor sp.]|nr:glycosyltransferase family 9 protein [Alloprevotella sp.]MCM1116196.1 glycosyltransferase family 9 protein [Pseudoflavonifractor sp.]
MASLKHDKPVVVALRFSALGDVAMTSTVMTAAARRFPSHRFVMVTRPQFVPFFPPEVEVMAADLKGRHKGLSGLWRLATDIWRLYRPVAVADLHDVIRSRLVSLFLRLHSLPVATIDKGRRDKKALVKGEANRPLIPTSERYAATLSRLGFDIGAPILAPLGQGVPASPPRIGLAPFAAHPGKAWPLEMMAKAVEMVRAARPDVYFLWFSAPGSEADKIKAVAGEKDTIAASLGLNGLGDEIELMGSLSAMVAMDSGNMHMAALKGIPVISIWGATHPNAGFAGASSPTSLRLQDLSLPCRPCSIYGNKPCRISPGEYPCLNAVSPTQVADKILSLIPQS